MDLESFEPSDESMERIEERLRALRELREVHLRPSFRSKFHHHFEYKISHDFSLKIDSVDRNTDPFIFSGDYEEVSLMNRDTAHMRTLKHESLLKDLERLGFREWKSLGKKDEFDRITRQAIELSQLETHASDNSYQDSEGALSAVEALNTNWVNDLEQLNRRARGVLFVNAQPNVRFTLADSRDMVHVFPSEENFHHNIRPVKINNFLHSHLRGTGDYWVRRSAHEPLHYLIEVNGLHAEVARNDDDVVVKYEGCEQDVLIGQHR